MQINQQTTTYAREMLLAAIFLQFALCWCAGTKKAVIAYPSILEERMAGATLVLKVTEDITLNLERSSVLADKLLFVTSGKEEHHVERVDTSFIQKDIYHDTHRQSSVMVRTVGGALQVEGILDSELRIKPLLQAPRSLDGQIAHEVYEVEEKADPREMRTNFRTTNNRERIQRKSSPNRGNNRKNHAAGNRQQGGDAFKVELHVISDNQHQRSFKKNEELIGYMAVMLNAVNLRYSDMARPKVSFMLVGITRSKDDVFETRVKSYLHADKTLNGLWKYSENGRVPGNPDMVYLSTGLDMVNASNGQLDQGLTGLAYIGKVCTKYKVGLGEDTATTYSGTHTMAHELCHLLGSPHDTTPECPWEEGFMMSYVDGGLKKYRLSPCSQKSVRNIYRNLRPECIQVKTQMNYMTKYKKYPGQTLRDSYYCKKAVKKPGKKFFVRRKEELNQKCKMQCCYTEQRTTTCWTVNILSGMSCGEGKTCKRGVCGNHTFP
uniref:Putative tick salivary metalloprotease n=1 Tax=Rhipicephalus pulchellus TaxID=72859 RepID=L7LTR9_RHIPC